VKIWSRFVLKATTNIGFRTIFTFFGFALIAGLWLALWSYLSISSRERNNQYLTQLENTAIAIGQSVANDIGQIDFLLKMLAESKKYAKVAEMPLYEMRHIFTLQNDMYHVSFTDAAGFVKSNTAFPSDTRKVNISDREHFRIHKERGFGRLFISKPVMGRGTKKFTIQFSRGIFGPAGDFQGAAVVGVSPTSFLSNLEGLNLGDSSGIALIGADDIVRASTGSFLDAIGNGFREHKLLQTLRVGAVEITERVRHEVPQIYAVRKVPGYDLSVVIATDRTQSAFWLASYALSLIMGGLLLTAVIALLVLIGRRKIKLEQLQIALQEQISANEMQRNFISMASHEFRNPLAIIDSSAQKLAGRAGSIKPEDVMARTKTIRGAVKRMTDLMESILAVAKINSSRLDLNKSTFSLGSMVQAVVSRASELDGRRIFNLDIQGPQVEVEADRLLLEQVVTNLVSNAMKYSPSTEPIEVRCGWSKNGATIEVSDRGVGIDESDLRKLFSRFFRAKSAEGIPGTGIGLHFVKLIVEQHGGEIGVRSKLGVGTTFTVRLPISCSNPRSSMQEAA
jgi:signal transduction histidine kinase